MISKTREYISDLGVVGVLSCIIIFGVILFIGIYICSYISFGSHYGRVLEKEYSPSYMVGSGTNNVTYRGESYSILLEKNGKKLWVNVTKDEYDDLKIGDCYVKCD